MTAEIAILNREAIALAADSAVTMIGTSGDKIFTSANKLFTLSKYHPVGIMIYGNALFMGVPWEVIIKIYRKELGSKKFANLVDYANSFISFIEKNSNLFAENSEEIYLKSNIYAYLNFLKQKIIEKIEQALRDKDRISEKEIRSIISSFIKDQYKIWEKAENSPNMSENFHKEIIQKYENEFNKAINEVLERLPMTRTVKRKIIDILGYLFTKFPADIKHTGTSGVVIAGYGDDDIFPSLVAYKIEGLINGKLKYKIDTKVEVNFDTEAIIIPFAQEDMVHMFMEGVHPEYISIENEYLKRVFDQFIELVGGIDKSDLKKATKSILDDFQENLKRYRTEKYINPIMSVVAILPKDELASMAEALINLTSLKRRWSADRETVGGPIDVAVISKGDGFIWIKRKHYFKAELNPQFFEKYFMEVEYD